jgi:hypothetical protein
MDACPRQRFGVLQPSGAFRRPKDVRKRRRAGALQDADARCGICQRIRWFEGFKHGRAHGAEMLVHSFGVPGRVWKPVWKSRSDERAVARPFKAGNSQRRHTPGHPVSQSDTRTCRVGRTGSGVALRRGSWLNAITRILSRPSKAGQRDGCRSAAEVFKHGPRRGSQRPRTGSLRPRIGSMRPRTTAMRPRTSSLRPRIGSLRPRIGSLRPRTTAMRPRTSSLRPHTTAMRPRTSSLRPRTSSLRPRIGSMRPRTSSLQPRTGSLRPRTGSLRPRTGSLRPRTGVSSPAGRLKAAILAL